MEEKPLQHQEEGEFRRNMDKVRAEQKKYRQKARASTEVRYIAAATWDVETARDMYIKGAGLMEICEGLLDRITGRPVPLSRLKECIRRFYWYPRKEIYELVMKTSNKEMVQKVAEAKAAIFEQGRKAGASEQKVKKELSFAETQLEAAESQARRLMDEGKTVEAMTITMQVERLRKLRSAPAAPKTPRQRQLAADHPEDEAPIEDEDEAMRLLDQAVNEVEPPLVIFWRPEPEDVASGQ